MNCLSMDELSVEHHGMYANIKYSFKGVNINDKIPRIILNKTHFHLSKSIQSQSPFFF